MSFKIFRHVPLKFGKNLFPRERQWKLGQTLLERQKYLATVA